MGQKSGQEEKSCQDVVKIFEKEKMVVGKADIMNSIQNLEKIKYILYMQKVMEK